MESSDDLGTLGAGGGQQAVSSVPASGSSYVTGAQSMAPRVGPLGADAAMVLATEGTLGSSSAAPTEIDSVHNFFALAELGRRTLEQQYEERREREATMARLRTQGIGTASVGSSPSQQSRENKKPHGASGLIALAELADDELDSPSRVAHGGDLTARNQDDDSRSDGATTTTSSRSKGLGREQRGKAKARSSAGGAPLVPQLPLAGMSRGSGR